MFEHVTQFMSRKNVLYFETLRQYLWFEAGADCPQGVPTGKLLPITGH